MIRYVYIELERYLEYEKNTFFISVVFGGVSKNWNFDQVLIFQEVIVNQYFYYT